MSKYVRGVAVSLLTAGLVVMPALAQDLYVYPAKGQSAEQTEKDKFQCYEYGKNSTGFDPMETPTATRAAPAQSEGSVAGDAGRGALGGAALGGVVGAIAGDTKKGLAIGAASGGLFGGMRGNRQRKSEQQAHEQWEQEQVATYNQNRSNYNRAYTACLEGRGYTVR